MSLPRIDFYLFGFPLRADCEKGMFRQNAVKALFFGQRYTDDLQDFFKKISALRYRAFYLLSRTNSVEEDLDKVVRLYLAHLRCIEKDEHGALFTFEWKDVICAPQTILHKGVRYEILNILVSTALWKCNAAASLFYNSNGRVNSTEAGKALGFYQRALGILQCCESLLNTRQHASSDIVNDVNPAIVNGMFSFVRAECQAITVIRAIEKKSSSGVVSSLASWAHIKYQDASTILDQRGKSNYRESFLDKIAANAQYKAACFEVIALVYAAERRLEEKECGQAEKLVTDAETRLLEVDVLASQYSSILPIIQPNNQTFHLALKAIVERSSKQIKDLNVNVYLAKAPVLRPDMPYATELIKISVFALPDRDTSINMVIFKELKCAAKIDQGGTPSVVDPYGKTSMVSKVSQKKQYRWLCCFG